MYRALEKGLSFKTTFGNVLTLTPPLTVTEAEMMQALDIIAARSRMLSARSDSSLSSGFMPGIYRAARSGRRMAGYRDKPRMTWASAHMRGLAGNLSSTN